MTDAVQGMLFGATPAAGRSTGVGATDELRLCALNVNSPGPGRAQRIVDWLLATKCDALVLTELRPTDGGRQLLAGLQAEGFTTTCTPGWADARHATVVATRGVEATMVRPVAFDPCIAAVDLATAGHSVRLVGVYGPTNGMTADSSRHRREVQLRLLDYLSRITCPALCVAGDLNVVEPDHRPHLPAFEDHDYALYTGLLALGLRDAYRAVNPSGNNHSWISPRYGSQRLDHILVGVAAGNIQACAYDHSTRAENLSDHAAVLMTIALGS